MKTLKDFTPEIKAKIPEYIDRALSGVFDGGRYKAFSWDDAYAAVCLQYEYSAYKKPLMVVCENPLEAQVLYNFSKLIFTNNSQLDSQLRSQLYGQLDSQLRSQLYSQLESQLESQLYGQLYSQLYSQLRSQLGSQLRSQLGSQLYSQLRSQKIEYTNDYLFTLNVSSSCYFAWYSFIANELKIEAKINADLKKFSLAYEKSNIYSAIFTEGICFVSKYPKRVYRDNNNNLHNPSGPAVDWGFSSVPWDCYYINGRNLPRWIWDKAARGEITKEMFLKEQNSEIKGGIYEVLGQRKMMELLGAKEVDTRTIVHANGDLEEVTLLKTKERFSEIDNQPFAWVKMVCPSTGTTYLQGVEPHHKNAIDAIASLSMFSPSEYSFDFRS